MRRKVIMDTCKIDLMLLPNFVFGAEGDEDPNPADNQEQDPAGSDPEPTDAENKDNEHPDRDDPDVQGLRSALAKERRERARLEKEAKLRAKADEEAELKKKSDIEQAQAREQAANEKLQRLAEGYRRNAVDAAIRAAASNFIDPNDAITSVDRTQIEVEQDDDDPSQVTVDTKSVERVVKALAAKKSHWLKKPGTEDGEKTGSTFGGTRSKSEKSKEEIYRERYPSLRH